MTSNLQNLLKTLDNLREKLNSKRPLSSWSEKTKDDFINDWTYHSNKIEGLKYYYGDTIKLLRKGIIKPDGTAKDVSDLFNHRDLLRKIFGFYGQPVTVASIKSLHKELMQDPIQHTNEDIDFKPGEFKSGYNYGTRKNGIFKEYAPPWEVKRKLEQMVAETTIRLE